MTDRDWMRVRAHLAEHQAKTAEQINCPKAVAARHAEAMAASGYRQTSFNNDLFPGSFRHVTPELVEAVSARQGAR